MGSMAHVGPALWSFIGKVGKPPPAMVKLFAVSAIDEQSGQAADHSALSRKLERASQRDKKGSAR